MTDFNPFKFSGRLGRLQYFGFAVIWAVILTVLFMAIGGSVDPETGAGGAGGGLFAILSMITYGIATISYAVRRFHDFDKSGWWVLLNLIPFVNFVVGLVLLFAPPSPSAQEENRYGYRTQYANQATA
jgi:uncharacterized membrane protein YhaH (DUF805 family)